MTAISPIASAILKIFEKNRIVFWYDADAGSRATFDELDLPEIGKIVVENNELTVKHRFIITEPDK
jgi:hypothetical protein